MKVAKISPSPTRGRAGIGSKITSPLDREGAIFFSTGLKPGPFPIHYLALARFHNR